MGIMSELENMVSVEDATIIGNAALESEVVLAAIRNECESDEEFAVLMESAATELALYDVISDAEIATEATKKIVIKDWKAVNFDRIAKRTAIRLAMVAHDNLYTKYRFHRDKLIDVRNQIYKKYGNKARKEAKRIIMNARNKAANMNSKSGKDITSKIDKQIAKAEAKQK